MQLQLLAGTLSFCTVVRKNLIPASWTIRGSCGLAPMRKAFGDSLLQLDRAGRATLCIPLQDMWCLSGTTSLICTYCEDGALTLGLLGAASHQHVAFAKGSDDHLR
eukprot:TRINITY_DN33279_c0_g1_i1.p3 TRINITY_DN33279_c0_g1~~TRINITY_DN33279_c0_g1_i1.p3  ORF type:complete len:106 (-),score=8.59 TRINITY_DN33279_c0_g1_i1:464-781(-)